MIKALNDPAFFKGRDVAAQLGSLTCEPLSFAVMLIRGSTILNFGEFARRTIDIRWCRRVVSR